MAYDPVKAHEYYMKYRKKGLKKGRKKGKTKTTVKKEGLVGLSSYGLNDAGKMQAAMVKDKIKDEMNAELAKATTPEQKEQIKQKYQQKALDAISKLKSDPNYAKAKAQKAAKETKGKASSGKSGGGSKSEGKEKAEKSKGGKSSGASSTKAKTNKQLKDTISKLRQSIMTMTPEQRTTARARVESLLNILQKRLKAAGLA